jgi:hypothetical protein
MSDEAWLCGECREEAIDPFDSPYPDRVPCPGCSSRQRTTSVVGEAGSQSVSDPEPISGMGEAA